MNINDDNGIKIDFNGSVSNAQSKYDKNETIVKELHNSKFEASLAML